MPCAQARAKPPERRRSPSAGNLVARRVFVRHVDAKIVQFEIGVGRDDTAHPTAIGACQIDWQARAMTARAADAHEELEPLGVFIGNTGRWFRRRIPSLKGHDRLEKLL